MTSTPNPTPGAAYWVLTTLVLPLAGVAAVFALAPVLDFDINDTPGLELVIASVVAITTCVVAFLPRLRAMAPSRRAVYVAVAAAVQAILVLAYGFLTIVALLATTCDKNC